MTEPWPIARRLEREWRRLATGLCFLSFGLLALAFGVVVCPVITLLQRDAHRRAQVSQRWLGGVMRLFLAQMRAMRVLTYSVEGVEGLARPGALVVANHPSLIDVVLLMGAGGGMTCVAKTGLFHNRVLGLAVRALGFVDNSHPLPMVEACVEAIRSGGRVLAFPEGSRTVPGHAPVLHRGAAVVAVRAACPVVPVTIRVSEPTLYKGAAWFDVPRRRPHFSVVVHPPMDAGRFGAEHVNQAVATRRLNEWLQQFFTQEMRRGSA